MVFNVTVNKLELLNVLDWKMVKENMRCDGAVVNKGKFLGIGGCSSACNGLSTLFIYGTTESKCDQNGCNCWCETSAGSDGTCNLIPMQGYKLYTYKNLNPGESYCHSECI